MNLIALITAGALVAMPENTGADAAPRLPYLENPSVTYGDCVAAVSSGQTSPRIAAIGAGPCRQPRSILLSAVRYHVATRWSSLATNPAEARRISAQVDASAQSIVAAYEADLQRWLDARPASNGNLHAQNR